MSISALLAKAAKANPPPKICRSSWAGYLPVIEKLMSERKFNLWHSVAWLVAQGEIEAAKQRNAYNSLAGVLARRKGRA